MFDHGSNHYLKGAFQSGPQADITKNIFKRVCELNAAPGNEIEHRYMFVYFSHRVLLTVPEDATAFLRPHRCLTECALKWARKSPSLEDAARRAARELTNIVAEAEARVSGENNIGYGNISRYHLQFLMFRSSHLLTNCRRYTSRLRCSSSENCQRGPSA